VCNTDSNECVQCLKNDHCVDPDASACDAATNMCVSCTDDSGGSHLADTTVCDTSGGAGVCVRCTVDDESACGGNSCDPAVRNCTGSPIGQTGTCMPCKADSECIADHRCVPMEFQGTQLDDGFCLPKRDPTDGCLDPFKTRITRSTLSGLPSAIYCGVDESVTTCAAVLDHRKSCSISAGCGMNLLDDAQCSSVDYKCTYPCSNDGDCDRACENVEGLCSLE
jgi:hypothetical protein